MSIVVATVSFLGLVSLLAYMLYVTPSPHDVWSE
jgi:hypothetical protein